MTKSLTVLSDEELLGRGSSPIRASADPNIDLAFFDRDGTLNVHRSGRYVSDPEDLVLIPGAGALVRRFNEAGIPAVLVTNQQGIATGRLQEPDLLAVQRRLVALLAREGAHLDAVELCPHLADSCDCRKPAPGMLRRALARAPWARAERSVFFGDQPTDRRAAHAVGVRFLAAPAEPANFDICSELGADM